MPTAERDDELARRLERVREMVQRRQRQGRAIVGGERAGLARGREPRRSG